MPAGFIGQFGQPGNREIAPRKRMVWVARRGAARTRRDKAENVGVSRQKSNLYDSSQHPWFSLDPTLSRSESVLGFIEYFCGNVIEEGRVEARFVLTGMAQFIAGLLIRHPNLATPEWSNLGMVDKKSATADIRDRGFAFWRTVDHLIFNAKWSIVESRSPLVTSDLGYVWFPSGGLGVIHLPIHPYALLQISPGRTFYRGDRWFWVDRQEWAQEEWLKSQLALMSQAQEVYAENEELASLALSVMSLDEPLKIGGQDLSALPDTRRLGFLPTMVDAQAPLRAWRRTHLVQNDFVPCNCERDNLAAGMTLAEHKRWAEEMAAIDAVAELSVPRREVISPWDLLMGDPYSRRPLQISPRVPNSTREEFLY